MADRHLTSTIRVHDNWASVGFALRPLVDHVGPFAGPALLEAWHRRRGHGHVIEIVEGPGALLALARHGDEVCFAGEADLTDYHTPLAESDDAAADLVTAYAATLASGTQVHLDSMPERAAVVVAAGLAGAGLAADPVQHEITAVLDMAGSFDDWLGAIGRKQRHEVRRKGRRFGDGVGAPRLARQAGVDAVARFADLHRRSSGAKGAFMTDDMEAWFGDLHRDAGAVIDFLHGDGDRALAAAFGFEDAGVYYLYNSAYEPEAADVSPGMVLISALVERAASTGSRRIDFLKGSEGYKFRHGARPRPLFTLDARVR
jgi:CelD/BcsL family acetyltransferase involved in cellulose biosynthesis